MQDLTVIFLTANQHPEGWKKFHKERLLHSIGDFPLITVTREPIEMPGKIILDKGPKSHANMYFQLLLAAYAAETEFIATAEDDVLYHPQHFTFYRPPKDSVAYDMHRWLLFTWNPVYNMKQRVSNCTLIAPREYLIQALEERFDKYSVENFPAKFVSEVGRYEKQLGVTERNMQKIYCRYPTVQFNHVNGTDSTGLKKALGEVRAYDIPYWGKAEELVKHYDAKPQSDRASDCEYCDTTINGDHEENCLK